MLKFPVKFIILDDLTVPSSYSGQNWRLRCLPYFYVIGMQKCGTSALTRLINYHLPEYARGLVKEFHFWEFKRFYGWWHPERSECGKE